MSASAFNTREFFHGVSELSLGDVRWVFVSGLLVLSLALQLSALTSAATWPWAALLQAPSPIAERW